MILLTVLPQKTKGYQTLVRKEVCQVESLKGFNYVITTKDKERIAFGSSAEREVLPLKRGVNRFTCQNTPELLLKITPTLYNTSEITSAFHSIRTKIVSKRGVGGTVNTASRFRYEVSLTPSPLTYNIRARPSHTKCNKYPFNLSTPRLCGTTRDNPGVGVYNVCAPCNRSIQFWYSFGGHKVVDSGADIKCCPENLDICSKCNKSPYGDYWHLKMKQFLCRKCKFEEDLQPTIIDKSLLDQYRRIRDCSFKHKHEGTKAAIRLMNYYELHELQSKEAYLDQYFSTKKGKILNEDQEHVLPWPLRRYQFKRRQHLGRVERIDSKVQGE